MKLYTQSMRPSHNNSQEQIQITESQLQVQHGQSFLHCISRCCSDPIKELHTVVTA